MKTEIAHVELLASSILVPCTHLTPLSAYNYIILSCPSDGSKRSVTILGGGTAQRGARCNRPVWYFGQHSLDAVSVVFRVYSRRA